MRGRPSFDSKSARVWIGLFIFASMFGLVLVPVLSPVGSSSAQKPMVGEDDVYTKGVQIGDRGRFNWTVFKNSTNNYVVTVNVEGFEDWERSVSPSYFVLDEDEPYEIVTMKFNVPEYPDKDENTGTVVFNFRTLNGTETYQVQKQVKVEVTGLPGGEANTIVGGFENPLPEPLNNPWGAFILNLVIWFAIAFFLFSIISPVVHKLAKRTKTGLDDLLVKMIRRPLLILVFLYGFIHSVLRLNLGLGIRATVYQIYSIILIVILVYVIYQIFDGILDEIAVDRGGETSPFGSVLKPIFEKIGAVVILVGGLIFGLNVMGIEVTALLAGAGIMGLVIAFAAQDTLSNFFSGMHLLLDRPFKIGDVILLETGEYCRVDSVGMRSTKLYSIFEHELIVLPNNTVANQKIVNLVEPDTTMRVSVEVGVAYGSDIEKVQDILLDVVGGHPNVLTGGDKDPFVRFSEFGESSLNFTVRFWVDDYMNQWKVMSEVRDGVDARFREEGITIPFPQRTVWLHSEEQESS